MAYYTKYQESSSSFITPHGQQMITHTVL